MSKINASELKEFFYLYKLKRMIETKESYMFDYKIDEEKVKKIQKRYDELSKRKE